MVKRTCLDIAIKIERPMWELIETVEILKSEGLLVEVGEKLVKVVDLSRICIGTAQFGMKYGITNQYGVCQEKHQSRVYYDLLKKIILGF